MTFLRQSFLSRLLGNTAIACLPVLPLLADIGYRIENPEIWIFFALAMMLCLVTQLLIRRESWNSFVIILVSLLVSLDFYFGLRPWSRALALFEFVVLCFVFPLGQVILRNAVIALSIAVCVSSFMVAKHTRVLLENQIPSSSTRRPAVIHLIFDELGSVARWPSSEKSAEFLQVFKKHGFKVFSEVRSTAGQTHGSFSAMMNLHPQMTKVFEEIKGEEYSFRLLHNKLFDELTTHHWPIEIIQSNYLDLIPFTFDRSLLKRATVYHPHFNGTRMARNLTVTDRARLLCGIVDFWIESRSHSYLREVLLGWNIGGVSIKQRVAESCKNKLQSFAGFDELENFIERVPSLASGTYYLIHILFPHHPYFVDSSCRLLPSWQWLSRITDYGSNTLSSRALRYERYIDQNMCLANRLEALFSSLEKNEDLRDAIVIVQGDHGSRISLEKSELDNNYSEADWDHDWFDSLFAIRSPTKPFPEPTNREESLPDFVRTFTQFLMANN